MTASQGCRRSSKAIPSAAAVTSAFTKATLTPWPSSCSKKAISLSNAGFFLHLDSADAEYQQHLKQPLKTYFTAISYPSKTTGPLKRTHGLSTRNYNFSDTSTLEDSLKTTPTVRIARPDPRPVFSPSDCDTHSRIRKGQGQQNAHLESLYLRRPYPLSLFVSCSKRIREIRPWYDFMVSNVFYSPFLFGSPAQPVQCHRHHAEGIYFP